MLKFAKTIDKIKIWCYTDKNQIFETVDAEIKVVMLPQRVPFAEKGRKTDYQMDR